MAECRHEESLYGRCVACGKTWEQQAAERAEAAKARLVLQRAVACPMCGEETVYADLNRWWCSSCDAGQVGPRAGVPR